MSDMKRYLEWHGQQWRVRIKVPDRLRELIGKSKLVEPLHTANLKEANDKKWAVVAKLKSTIQQAQQAQETKDPIDAEALMFRQHIKREPKWVPALGSTPEDDDPLEQLYEEDEGARYLLSERAEEIRRTDGLERAQAFHRLGSHETTLLSQEARSFNEHKGYTLKSGGDFLRVLNWLSEWLSKRNLASVVEVVDRKVAGQFISEFLLVGRGHLKAKAYLGFLREYWRWMAGKGILIDENPWKDQPLGKPRRPHWGLEPDEGKRPFTDDELFALLNGPADPLLYKLIRIAALSGMRLEEICQLQVRDCEDGVFNIRVGKTENARRKVPIHSDLKPLVERCMANRYGIGNLIQGLPPISKSRESRSDPAAKRFTRYRRKCGVDERPNGKAKSNVDFHSLRRWFVRKSRDARLKGGAAYDEWTLAEIIGHSTADAPKGLHLSQRGYAGPDSMDPKRALIEAIRLPIATKEKDTE